jgi:7-cyano-7-deazaguanine synthase in queuosine biosynthesis
VKAAGRLKAHALHIDVNAPAGTPERVNLEIGDISKRLADNIPDVLTDMLEIAAYVYCADQFTKRGSIQMARMGADWRRQFWFRIPVRRPDVWTKSDVREALTTTLGFLSEDEFEFEFLEGSNPPPLQAYLPLDDPAARAISPEEVVLFSGGLDSLAGAVDALIGHGRQVILVSHRSSPMVASKQNALVAILRERCARGKLFYVPVAINKGQEQATEFTQRTRSLIFATLGFIVARMFGRNDLCFYENGVVSINLPIAEHVLGARATRTTHPKVLADCGRLFSLLLSEDFRVRNPFIWKTKEGVLRVLADRNCTDLIAATFSCTRVREATQRRQHCGKCSQCVDRRFGVLAAGMSEYDPAEGYSLDLFTGAHEPGPDLTLIECYVLRAQRLATMTQQSFVETYGQIFRAIPHLSGSVDENVKRIWEMHRRHGQEVISVVDRELQSKATTSGLSELPTSSLLAMVVSPVAKQPAYTDPADSEPTAAAQAQGDTHDYSWKRFAIAIDTEGQAVLFEGRIEFRGSIFQLIAALAEDFRSDWKAGTFRDHYRFVRTNTLAKRLHIDEQSLRQQVSRARKKIELAFLKTFDRHVDGNDLIQNEEGKGYRLNPYLLLVEASQLREETGEHVTG